jgi:NodT family efflux transporter outer membrane factor (OMF) lipoprotein
VVAALCVAACTTLGPDYDQSPITDVERDWLEAQAGVETTVPTDPQWWKEAFRDPELNALVETSLAQNLTLRSAGLRVLQARQQLTIALGQRYPVQTLGGSLGAQRRADNELTPGEEQHFLSDQAGFDVSWEADVWGRFRRLAESASAQLDASVASYDGVLLSLLADVTQNYLQIRTLESRIRYSRANVATQQGSLQIALDRFEGGLTTELDPDQARSLLYNTRAELGSLEITLAQLKNVLSFLLGQSPRDVSDLLGGPGAVPAPPPEIALGMPQDLLRRRPDIREAERLLAAQSAQIGFAIADLYPSFQLGGAVQLASTDGDGNDLDDVFSSDGLSWDATAGFSWNVWNYGRIKGNIRLQDARFQQLAIDYQNSVLNAQAEVENAIVAYLISQQQVRWYELAERAARNAVNIAQVQYRDGLVDFNTVITNLQVLRQQQDLLASTQGAVANNLVSVYLALGGGWEIRSSDRAEDLIPEETREEMRARTRYWEGELN